MTETEKSLSDLLRRLPSPGSRRIYEKTWERYCTWLVTEKVTPEAAKPRHVERYILHLFEAGQAKSTRSTALSIIREVYGALVRNEVVSANPAREVKNPRAGNDPVTPWLEEEQVKKLFSAQPDTWKGRRDHLCLCLLFGLGWRRAEIARLRVEDFRDGAVTGKVKGGKRLTAGVPTWLSTLIEEWCDFADIKSGPLLIRSPKKREAVTGNIVYKIVESAAFAAGLSKGSVSPHALRRTNITLGGARGISLKDRQLSVGHSSQSTTERYDRARDASKNAPGEIFSDLVRKKD